MPEVIQRGVDYSYARPNLNCLKDNNYKFVLRYFATGEPGKELNPPELSAILNAGLRVAVVFQDGTSDLLRGWDEGVKDARHALEDARSVDMPRNRPIYFALDFDPSTLSNSEITDVKAYLNGAASIMGRNRVGIYGGYRAIELFCPNPAPWGWQTYAWSRGQISDKAHLRQYKNNVNVCGGAVDLNESYQQDFGQWPIAAPREWDEVATKEEIGDVVFEKLRDMLADNSVLAERLQARLEEEFNEFTPKMEAKVKAVFESEISQWGGEFRTALRTIVDEEVGQGVAKLEAAIKAAHETPPAPPA